MENLMLNQIAKKMFLRSLQSVRDCSLEVVCPEATYEFGEPSHDLRATVAVHNDDFFRRALFGGDIGAGESYMDGDWSSPDLVKVIQAATRNMMRIGDGHRVLAAFKRLASRMGHRLNDNTLSGSRRNISYHYDLGNEFYSLFLGPTLAYSCAVFETPDDSLEAAQLRKFDLICQRLQLSAKDHLLEIGTGWGGFAAYAARQYGCRITTTTISRQQHDYASELFSQLREEGHQVELLFEDYRKLSLQYDKIVSIEMFEAVGYRHYDEYFRACDRLLKPGGSMFLQTITMNEQHFRTYLKQSDWIKKYIFPGAELASVAGVIQSIGRATKLQLVHFVDIGPHYAETLRAWRLAFLLQLTTVRKLGFNERFIRMWEFYLAYCEGGFRERYIGDAQILLEKHSASRPDLAYSTADRFLNVRSAASACDESE